MTSRGLHRLGLLNRDIEGKNIECLIQVLKDQRDNAGYALP